MSSLPGLLCSSWLPPKGLCHQSLKQAKVIVELLPAAYRIFHLRFRDNAGTVSLHSLLLVEHSWKMFHISSGNSSSWGYLSIAQTNCGNAVRVLYSSFSKCLSKGDSLHVNFTIPGFGTLGMSSVRNAVCQAILAKCTKSLKSSQMKTRDSNAYLGRFMYWWFYWRIPLKTTQYSLLEGAGSDSINHLISKVSYLVS